MHLLKKYKNSISALFSLLFLSMLVWYVYTNRNDFLMLLDLNPTTMILMMVFAFGCCVSNMFYHKTILGTHQMTLTITDWMGVVSIANVIAYVVPMRADLLFTASYYKKTKGLAYTKSASMSAGNIVFGIVFALLQMGVSLLVTGIVDGMWSLLLWLLWLGMVVGTGGLIGFSLLFDSQNPPFLKKITILWKVVDGFQSLLKNPKFLCRLLLCLVVNNVFHLCLYMTCFSVIGLQVPLYQALFYNSVSWLITMVAIVPGNIGIKEGVMGIASR